jgi:hypothetical protein
VIAVVVVGIVVVVGVVVVVGGGAGVAEATTAVAPDVAAVEPRLFVAVTMTRIV